MATLLLLPIDGIYTAGKPPAAQAIKPAHLIDGADKCVHQHYKLDGQAAVDHSSRPQEEEDADGACEI